MADHSRHSSKETTMAIAKQGINGVFKGKIGSVVGYELGGQNVMRSVGRRTKPFSQLELLNQAKMKVVSEFLGRIKPYVKFGFQREAPAGSRVGAFQLAQSYTRKNAVDVDDDGKPFVNPEKVLISRGQLPPPVNCKATQEGNVLVLSWDHEAKHSPYDRLVVLLYDGDSFRFFQDIGAERREMRHIIDYPYFHLIEGPVHVYAAFRDTMQDRISDSVYCGSIKPKTPSSPNIDRARPHTAPEPPSPPNGQLGLAFPD